MTENLTPITGPPLPPPIPLPSAETPADGLAQLQQHHQSQQGPTGASPPAPLPKNAGEEEEEEEGGEEKGGEQRWSAELRPEPSPSSPDEARWIAELEAAAAASGTTFQSRRRESHARPPRRLRPASEQGARSPGRTLGSLLSPRAGGAGGGGGGGLGGGGGYGGMGRGMPRSLTLSVPWRIDAEPMMKGAWTPGARAQSDLIGGGGGGSSKHARGDCANRGQRGEGDKEEEEEEEEEEDEEEDDDDDDDNDDGDDDVKKKRKGYGRNSKRKLRETLSTRASYTGGGGGVFDAAARLGSLSARAADGRDSGAAGAWVGRRSATNRRSKADEDEGADAEEGSPVSIVEGAGRRKWHERLHWGGVRRALRLAKKNEAAE